MPGKPRYYVLLSLLLIAAAVIALYSLLTTRSTITWDMVNVNYSSLQGDAHVLRVADKTILIDAGYYVQAKQELVPFLQKAGVKQIDYFFISHPHRDHYEGGIALLEAGISIDKMLFKEPARDVTDCCYSRSHLIWFVGKLVASGTQIYKPKTGYKLALPLGSSIELLHAQEGNFPDKAVDVNDLSMVMRWQVYGRNVLFTGDINKTVGSYLASDVRMKADILKIPHHGGRGLVPNSFYAQVEPQLALVPGPEWIWCGERGVQTRDWLQSHQVPTWVNGIDGTVQLAFSFTDVTISPAQPISRCQNPAWPIAEVQSMRRWPALSEVWDLITAGLRFRWQRLTITNNRG